MTLTEFLLARIAEDERVARAVESAKRPDPVSRSEFLAEHEISDVDVVQRWETRTRQLHDLGTHLVGAYPRRVLAECEAKRRIVEHQTQRPEKDFRPLPPAVDTPVLRLLALPYAGHPDYDEAWRP